MNRIILFLFIPFLTLFSCHKLIRYSSSRNEVRAYKQSNDSTLLISGISNDPNFGYSEMKPIMVGVYDVHQGAENVEKYLHALTGPNNEVIKFTRMKACCPFRTKNFRFTNGVLGTQFNGKYGMLEKYTGEYNDGIKTKSFILYFNSYDETKELLAPKELTYKGN